MSYFQSRLFDNDLAAIVDVNAFRCGFGLQLAAIEVEPVAGRDFARAGVEGADACKIAVTATEAHEDFLWQVTVAAVGQYCYFSCLLSLIEKFAAKVHIFCETGHYKLYKLITIGV